MNLGVEVALEPRWLFGRCLAGFHCLSEGGMSGCFGLRHPG